ncbi:MAG: ABC-type uncharacterized transport system permease subunit [Myxococcota bacterium]|jgi:ABC-type uncharacterized transport system permease subunit
MIRLLLVFALLFYVARGAASWSAHLKERLQAPWVLWAGIGAHSLGLIGELVLDGTRSTLHLALAGLALSLMLGNAYLQRKPRMDALEGVLLPLSALLLGLSLIAPGQASGAPLTWWLPVHIGFTVLGFGGLALTFSLSVLYLWVRRRLKAKKLVGIGRLPSLRALDDLNQQCMILGFVSLTAGMASGALWTVLGDAVLSDGMDVTVYATVALWLWYAVGLHFRLIAGYRGQIAAWFGVVGFGGVSLIMVSATLLFNSFHGAAG